MSGYPPQQYPPPPPQPVMPLGPLAYDTPYRPPRPGVITAVGVISICIACLGLLANCASVGNAFLWATLRNMPMPVVPARVPVPGPRSAGASATAPPLNRGGLTDGQRALVVATLGRIGDLPTSRREMLDRLLLETGDDIFPFAAELFTDSKITAAVFDSGLSSAGPGQATKNHYFIVGNGRIELSDDRATFSRSGAETVRVDREGAAEPVAAGASATGAPVAAGAGTATGTNAIAFGPSPFAGIQTRALALSGIDGGIGLLVSLFLLVAGILVLRDSPRGRGMHLLYAWVKFPLAVLSAWATWEFYSQMFTSMPVAPGSPPMPAQAMGTMMGVSSAMGVGITLIYPIALLIVMNTRTVKEYYSTHLRPA